MPLEEKKEFIFERQKAAKALVEMINRDKVKLVSNHRKLKPTRYETVGKVPVKGDEEYGDR